MSNLEFIDQVESHLLAHCHSNSATDRWPTGWLNLAEQDLATVNMLLVLSAQLVFEQNQGEVAAREWAASAKGAYSA